jgi:MYXO-CTERM domain-containing protein
MKCSHRTSVQGPVESVWASLRDVDAIAAALPGATLSRDGDGIAGSLKCTVGAAQITYKLTARADEVDAEGRRAVIAVTGKESRGTGTLTANLVVGVHSEGANAQVSVDGDIEATGRGEGADAAAWSRLIGRLLGAVVPASVPPSASASATAPAPTKHPASATPAAAPRPALAVAPATGGFDPDEPARSGPPPGLIAGLVVAVLLVLRRRRRKHRRIEGEPDDGE